MADKLCFFISAIGSPGSQYRKHSDLVLNYIVKPVASKAGFSVRRGDQAGHSGMITVDTVNALLEADLVVADLTFHNPNVFYELGLRHSTKRHTIHMATIETDLPFDNADHRAILFDITDWDSHERARATLEEHIGEMAKQSVTNPVTVALAHRNSARLQAVIDGVSTFVLQLHEAVERLTGDLPPGHVTRDQHKAIAQGHREEILQVVRAIRMRIDEDQVQTFTPPSQKVSDVLHRLSTIETIILNGNSAHVHPTVATPQ